MKTVSTCSVTLRLAEAQAKNTIVQIERLLAACAVPSEDHTEPVFQEWKDNLFFDFKVYDQSPEEMFHLGSMLGNAFGPAAIKTVAYKSSQKYRGFIQIEIQVPIKK